MATPPTAALIGAGAMGGALLRGWLAGNHINALQSAVFDPAPRPDIVALCARWNVPLNPDPDNVNTAIAVLAIKPQLIASVLPAYASLAQKALVLSVVAGASIHGLAAALGGAPKIIRAMPNLPVSIGKGATALFASDAVSAAERSTVENLMKAAGVCIWVDKETDIDLATAISGSGPAYFFLMAEALAEAGEAMGLSAENARILAQATFIGAGALLDSDGRSAQELRRAVTSPGGTTAAALDELDGTDRKMRQLMKSATLAAAARAAALRL